MAQSVAFGDYTFQLDSGQLCFRGQEVRLTPKAAAVLAFLVSNAGSPVSKGQLFASVWPNLAVTDDALTTCIQELRRVLNDDAKHPQFIETRHRRGYRFIAAMTRDDSATVTPATPAGAIASIAVLPFADMSPEQDQEYLCEGLAEELINALTRVDGLRVAARTASFQFRRKGEDIRSVGGQLNVEALLEGSVRKSEDRLRITVQLIEVATGYHRWSHRFDGQFRDVFAIQDEIAESVAASLRGGETRPPREKRTAHRPQTEPAAYELYLRGRQHLPRIRHDDLQAAADLFHRAIELEPGYGPAYAGLATAHSTLYEWFGATNDDLDGADRASRRALELAPDLAEAHVARGCALALMKRYEDASLEFEQAIRLNPNLFDPYYYYARSRFARGDVAGSATLFKKAAEVRHEDFQSPFLLAQSLKMMGQDAEASTWRREGIRRAEHVLALNPLDGRAMSLGALYLLEEGDVERAIHWSERALELNPYDMSALGNGACLQAKLGHTDRAIELLERVSAQGWGQRDWLERDPDYDNIRHDPRFQRLLTTFK